MALSTQALASRVHRLLKTLKDLKDKQAKRQAMQLFIAVPVTPAPVASGDTDRKDSQGTFLPTSFSEAGKKWALLRSKKVSTLLLAEKQE